MTNNLIVAISENNKKIFGIGTGKYVDGQIRIFHDLIGLFKSFRPKFAQGYIPQVLDSFVVKMQSEKDVIYFE